MLESFGISGSLQEDYVAAMSDLQKLQVATNADVDPLDDAYLAYLQENAPVGSLTELFERFPWDQQPDSWPEYEALTLRVAEWSEPRHRSAAGLLAAVTKYYEEVEYEEAEYEEAEYEEAEYEEAEYEEAETEYFDLTVPNYRREWNDNGQAVADGQADDASGEYGDEVPAEADPVDELSSFRALWKESFSAVRDGNPASWPAFEAAFLGWGAETNTRIRAEPALRVRNRKGRDRRKIHGWAIACKIVLERWGLPGAPEPRPEPPPPATRAWLDRECGRIPTISFDQGAWYEYSPQLTDAMVLFNRDIMTLAAPVGRGRR